MNTVSPLPDQQTPAVESSSDKLPVATTWPLWFAGAVACFWLLFLGILALTTANPATLNTAQLMNSQAGVLAEIKDPTAGTVQIADVIFVRPAKLPLQAGQTLKLTQHGSHWQAGEVRLLLLQQSKAGAWQITPSQHPKTPLLDYPADPALIEQIREQGHALPEA